MIGRLHAAGALRAGAELVGGAASTPESARAAAAALSAMHAFDTAQELVTASGVDVVHICTPNYPHRELAELALDAGKHVICEKPLAVSADDAERLAAAARQAGVVTGCRSSTATTRLSARPGTEWLRARSERSGWSTRRGSPTGSTLIYAACAARSAASWRRSSGHGGRPGAKLKMA
jgi:hypothetical protein